MPRLAITARPLLGGLQGHRGSGEQDLTPDPARLFSALVHAAGTGSSAVEQNGNLTLSSESEEALAWLENHPPTAIRIPNSACEPAGTVAFREEGVFENNKGASRKVGKSRGDFVAFDGVLGWAWDEEAPEAVVSTLDRLCAEVSCFGEADTPVVLEIDDFAPTHLLSQQQSAFVKQEGVSLRVPGAGRLQALESQYRQAYPSKRPTVAADRFSWGQRPASERPTADGLQRLRYTPIAEPLPEAPWTYAFASAVSRNIPVFERVQWAVSLHRALVSRLGDDAPSVITGRYAQGQKRPANRVAIQYVSGPTTEESLRSGAFVVMVPQGADTAAVQQLAEALRATERLYRGNHGEVGLTYVGRVSLDDFWLAPLPGMRRLWRATPALVPDVRRPKSAEQWRFEDSALVSIGLLFRDRLSLGRERGEARYIAIRDQVARWGTSATNVHRVADSRVERYVHKLPRDLVAQPYFADLDLSSLIGDRTLVALGQSRHLGGGLLEPLDVMEADRADG